MERKVISFDDLHFSENVTLSYLPLGYKTNTYKYIIRCVEAANNLINSNQERQLSVLNIFGIDVEGWLFEDPLGHAMFVSDSAMCIVEKDGSVRDYVLFMTHFAR